MPAFMSMSEFNHMCTPAKIYFAIAVVSCLFALLQRFPVASVLIKLLFAYIWAFVLNWLCSHGHVHISWFLVLLPYLLILFAMFQ